MLNTLQPELERNLDEIDLLKEQQATDIKGLSQQKDALRKTATQKAIEVCKALQLYAQMSDNILLANEVAYTATDFRKASDN